MPVQVRFPPRLRDQRSTWLQDGCKSLHGFLRGIEWIMFHGHLDYFQKRPLGSRPNTKLGDHGTPNAHNRWFILFYHVWGPTWIEIHWNSIWLRARSHMASHYTWGSVTTLHDIGGVFETAFGHFLLGSHNLVVTTLGSCMGSSHTQAKSRFHEIVRAQKKVSKVRPNTPTKSCSVVMDSQV